jgi:5-hydroxyisourate hydrolase
MTPITISTHVLNTATGLPVAGVPVALDRKIDGPWVSVSAAHTDDDGRIAVLAPHEEHLPAGRYRVVFDLEDTPGIDASWYPEITIVVDLAADSGHAHIPLLLAPFGYTTYRGS